MTDIFTRARQAWEAAANLRRARLRYKRYTFGRQWSDSVVTPDGRRMSEADSLSRQGQYPVQANLIRPIVKSIVGLYRTNHHDDYSGSPALLELDARSLEEFLISGCVIHRVSPPAATPEAVPLPRFFIDSLSTPEPEIMGVLHDMTLSQILIRFSHGRQDTVDRLTALFNECALSDAVAPSRDIGFSVNDALDWHSARSSVSMRVIEIWDRVVVSSLRCLDGEAGDMTFLPYERRYEIAAENARRRRSGRKPIKVRRDMTVRWRCSFYTGTGVLIDTRMESRHPFVYRFFPLIDGEVHPFVEDLIHQQRHINRLLTLHDFVLAHCAKGALLIPDTQVSDSMPVDELAARWASPNGVILYKGENYAPAPTQIITGSAGLGVDAVIARQMSLLQEVSGVSGVLRGCDPSGSTGAALYQRMQEGSQIALADLLGTFDAFIAARDSMSHSG